MAKQKEMLTLFSQYKAPQGFWLKNKTKVWIKPGKSQIEKDVYSSLMGECSAFKDEVNAEEPNIMVHTARQEAKAEKNDKKLLDRIKELEGNLQSANSKIQSLENRPKPGPKPGPKPQGKPS
jgi:hypothetical protein